MSNLKYVHGRVICSVNLEGKNTHKFADGTVIRLERQFNEFNRRITEPVNGVVISAENIPEGSEILISHNALHESNRIYNHTKLSGKEEASDIKYYSLPEEDCFAWRGKDGELKPMKNFAFALRVFRPYWGMIKVISITKLENVLYITTGELAGNVCNVLKASDYEIIFQGADGREDRLIRCRHYEDEINDREEVIAISHSLTDELKEGKLFIGLANNNSKSLKEYYG